MSNKVKFKWTDVENKVFDDIKHSVSQYTLLEYPDVNESFNIYTDDIYYQPVAVIIQNSKPIDFYSLKLTGPQTRYTVMKKELLSIVKTLKEFCTI